MPPWCMFGWPVEAMPGLCRREEAGRESTVSDMIVYVYNERACVYDLSEAIEKLRQ